MKIKVSQYLAEIYAAEQRGYSRGREDVYRERSENDSLNEMHEALRGMRKEIQAMKAQIAIMAAAGQSMHAPETSVGDEIAEKCF